VRNEYICSLRQSLEVTVITVGVPGEYDGCTAYADTPGNCRYATVDNLRGIQREITSAHESSDLPSCQGDIVRVQRVATIVASQEICQISVNAVFAVE
jgi:hypothetical protein